LAESQTFWPGSGGFHQEKVEAVVSEMVKRGELTEQESPQAVAEIMEKAKSNRRLY
jgi:polyhydroxyalkanoate synthesis regulator phasin